MLDCFFTILPQSFCKNGKFDILVEWMARKGFLSQGTLVTGNSFWWGRVPQFLSRNYFLLGPRGRYLADYLILTYTKFGASGSADHLKLLRLFISAPAHPHTTWVAVYLLSGLVADILSSTLPQFTFAIQAGPY